MLEIQIQFHKNRPHSITAASDKVYQLFAHGWWFFPDTPTFSTTKTDRHDIAEILLKLALNTKNQINYKLINSTSTILFSMIFEFMYSIYKIVVGLKNRKPHFLSHHIRSTSLHNFDKGQSNTVSATLLISCGAYFRNSTAGNFSI